MAISHVKTNGVADFTGTVTVFNSQGSTTTAAATDLLRPSDWNSVHNQYLTLTGNTLGASTLSGTNVVIGGGNNITLSQVNATRFDVVGANTVAQTNQTLGGYFVGNTTAQSSSSTFDARSMSVSGVGGISAGMSAGAMVVSGPAMSSLVAGYNASLSSNGSTVTIRAMAPAVSLSGNSTSAGGGYSNVSSGTLILAGGNNVTLSQNGASVTISAANTVAQTNQSLGLYASSQTVGQSSSSTVDARSLSIVGRGNISVGLSAGSFLISQTGGGGGAAISAGTESANTGTLVLSNSNNVSFGMNGSVITATVNAANTASTFVAGISTQGNTAGTTGFVSQSMQFVGGNNITLSQSVNGQSATLSIVGGGGGAGATLSALRPIDIGGYEWITGQYGQNQPFFFPKQVPVNLSLNVLQFPLLFSGATNSTGTLGISLDIGFYTWNNSSSFSLLTSMRVDTTITHSGTQNSVSNVGGIRVLRQSVAGFSLPPGDYIVGFRSSTSSAGANASFSHWVASNINTAQSGIFGANTNATYQMEPGLGYLSATSSVLPNGAGLSQLSGTNTYLLRPVLWTLYRTT